MASPGREDVRQFAVQERLVLPVELGIICVVEVSHFDTFAWATE